MKRAAVFDDNRTYRYRLSRLWDVSGPLAVWVMLNPSTADDQRDDPTIRRVVGFSTRWGFGSCVVVNLFAQRTRRPLELRRTEDPVGPANDSFVTAALASADGVIAAWGNHGLMPNPATGEARCEEMWRLLETTPIDVTCLGLTALAQPTHPLYLAADTLPVAVQGSRIETIASLARQMERIV